MKTTVETLRRALPHACAFVLPLITLLFVATGPHGGRGGLVLLAASATMLLPNRRITVEQAPARPGWAFDLVVYGMAVLQLVTVGLFVRMIAVAGWSWDLAFGAILVGNNSGWGGIVIAHELIHRRGRVPRLLGRILLGSVMYDHFYVEHLRGHHARVATDADPATARYGERLNPFIFRSIVGQLRSAWQLDRWTVLLGLGAQVVQLSVIATLFGPAALVAFVWQAFTAISLLETVNYFEHWGLSRRTPRDRAVESWDTDCWVTRHTLVGLALHADHHAHPQRHYEELTSSPQSPRLPYGYPRMVLLAQANNRRFRELMSAELQRCRLGPFAPSAL